MEGGNSLRKEVNNLLCCLCFDMLFIVWLCDLVIGMCPLIINLGFVYVSIDFFILVTVARRSYS